MQNRHHLRYPRAAQAAALRSLADINHIVHGGDVGKPDIIDALRRIAPGTAIRGNVDTGDWAPEYADTELARVRDKSLYGPAQPANAADLPEPFDGDGFL